MWPGPSEWHSPVVVEFEQQASCLGPEGSMEDTRWTAGIGVRRELLATRSVSIGADDQISGDQKDLFPIVVHEGRHGADAGPEAQEAGAAAALVCFIERASQNLLLDALGIARRPMPFGPFHVDRVEFPVF